MQQQQQQRSSCQVRCARSRSGPAPPRRVAGFFFVSFVSFLSPSRAAFPPLTWTYSRLYFARQNKPQSSSASSSASFQPIRREPKNLGAKSSSLLWTISVMMAAVLVLVAVDLMMCLGAQIGQSPLGMEYLLAKVSLAASAADNSMSRRPNVVVLGRRRRRRRRCRTAFVYLRRVPSRSWGAARRPTAEMCPPLWPRRPIDKNNEILSLFSLRRLTASWQPPRRRRREQQTKAKHNKQHHSSTSSRQSSLELAKVKLLFITVAQFHLEWSLPSGAPDLPEPRRLDSIQGERERGANNNGRHLVPYAQCSASSWTSDSCVF